jgi:hypothetical protein
MTTQPTTTTGTTTSNSSGSSAENALREAGSDIGGVLAGIHGVGEKVRGEFNGAIDEAFGEVGSTYPYSYSDSRSIARGSTVAQVGF